MSERKWTEREAFEAWSVDNGFDLDRNTREPDEYIEFSTGWAWEAWQGRAAIDVDSDLLEALKLCLHAVELAGWEGDLCAIKARAALQRAEGE